jgi:endogenous inhibitor of DNA gyrase (YacG/DUF329 family)
MVLEDSLLGRIINLFRPKKHEKRGPLMKKTPGRYMTLYSGGKPKEQIPEDSIKIPCPKCKMRFGSEDIPIDFSKLEKLSDGDIFDVKCPHCGHKIADGRVRKTKRTIVKKFNSDIGEFDGST